MVGNLKQIEELTEGAMELLSAVGVETLEALSENGVQGLYEEMEQANGHLGLLKDAPTEKTVASWIEKAQKITGKTASVSMEPREEKVLSMSALPVALAVKKEQILKNKIEVGDVPVMTDFVEEGSLAAEVKSMKVMEAPRQRQVAAEGTTVRKKKSVKKRRSSQKVEKAPLENREGVREVKPRGIPERKPDPLERSEVPEGGEKRPAVQPLKRNAGFDIRKTASPELNEGKKLHSRRYVRGVLHPQPGRVKFAALVSFLTFLLLPASFVACGLVVFKESVPLEQPLWLLAVPAAFLLSGFLYLVLAKPLKCRICGQPILASKSCRRHVKAHRFFLLGYIFPTSLHMMLFHWFRCIYCGTSVRLKT